MSNVGIAHHGDLMFLRQPTAQRAKTVIQNQNVFASEAKFFYMIDKVFIASIPGLKSFIVALRESMQS